MKAEDFVEYGVAGGAVVAARRREKEPADASLTRQARETHRGEMIDIVSELGVEVTQGIVGQRRQVNDGVEAVQETAIHVAQVGTDLTDGRRWGTKIAPIIEPDIEPGNLMPGFLHQRNHYRTDEAQVPGDQDFHASIPILSHASPVANCEPASTMRGLQYPIQSKQVRFG